MSVSSFNYSHTFCRKLIHSFSSILPCYCPSPGCPLSYSDYSDRFLTGSCSHSIIGVINKPRKPVYIHDYLFKLTFIKIFTAYVFERQIFAWAPTIYKFGTQQRRKQSLCTHKACILDGKADSYINKYMYARWWMSKKKNQARREE